MMGYDFKLWRERHYHRADITAMLTHLTREAVIDGVPHSAVEVLIRIPKGEIGVKIQNRGQALNVKFSHVPRAARSQLLKTLLRLDGWRGSRHPAWLPTSNQPPRGLFFRFAIRRPVC